MKNQILILAITFFVTSITAQQPVPNSNSGKGLSSLSTFNQQLSTSSYAVVVGISDYQDPAIPDLRFADKDAEAFANYLRSKAGGSLDADHLKVLVNSQATMAQLANVLDWLMENAKEGDQAIIYFSGHGDVEKKTLTQPGFLLCWDAPARVYMAGGAFNLRDIQEIISTLSIQNKAKVIVITDACHSGTLAGSSVGGSQATAANLAKQFANEIKIMSCQPNEYSIEGEQWGGGRGAFSYNLVNALYGLADNNNDLFVTLQEAGRYLEDHVTAEVAPVSQVPMIIGNRTDRLATIDPALLASIKSGKTNQMAMLSSIDSRGLEEMILSSVDTSVRELYQLFNKALKGKIFLEPKGKCADAYYEKLTQEPKLERLHSTMKRNYAAALQEDAQQVLNEWLKTNENQSMEAITSGSNALMLRKVFTEKVRSFPRCLERAAELLGSKHYMYANLKSRKYFFEGYLLANSNKNPNTELGEKSLTLFRQSLEWQAEQPQVYLQISQVFGFNFLQLDSMEHYARRAIQIYPNWVKPFTAAAYRLSNLKQFDRAMPFLAQASRIDSNSTDVLNAWGVFNVGKKNLAEGEKQFKKAIAMDSTNISAWNNLGSLYFNTRRYAEAKPVLKKAIAMDSTNVVVWNNLGVLYLYTGRYAEAEPVFKKAIAMDSTAAPVWQNLGFSYIRTRRYAIAEQVLKQAMDLDSTISIGWNSLGLLYTETHRYTEAEVVFKKSLALDSTNVVVWKNLGSLYKNNGRYGEAELVYNKAIALDSMLADSWYSLGSLYFKNLQYAEAQLVFKKAIALDSTKVYAWNDLGVAYLNTGRYTEAEPVLKKAIALDSTFANPRKHLGMVYFKTNRTDEARQSFLKAKALNSNYAGPLLGMAYLLLSEGKTVEAIGYVELAIGKGATKDQLEKDEDLGPLRDKNEQWNALMKKYFPEKAKD